MNRLDKIFQAEFNYSLTISLSNIDNIINQTEARLEDFDGQLRDYAAAKLDMKVDLVRFLRLRRRINVLKKGMRDNKDKQRNVREKALDFLKTKDLVSGKWNSPNFHKKFIEGIASEDEKGIKYFSLPCKVYLPKCLLRRFRQSNKSGTQHGATIVALNLFPPNIINGQVKANVFLHSIPDGDEAFPEPWFSALSGLTSNEKQRLQGYTRAVDINQLNCGRPYAHGILGPAPVYSHFKLEELHIPAVDLAILANLYCFGIMEWEKKKENEEMTTQKVIERLNSSKVGLNCYYGNVKGGPCFAHSILWSKLEDKENAIQAKKVKEVIPAFIFFWKIRQSLIDKKLTGIMQTPEDLPKLWKTSDFVFQCDESESILRLPLTGHPYNDLPYVEDILKVGLSSDVAIELENNSHSTSFNDEINFLPHYWAEKRAHLSYHQDILFNLINRISPSNTEALTDKQVVQNFTLLTNKSRRARCLINEYFSVVGRQTFLRDVILRYLSRCESYLALRFPCSYMAFEDVVFQSKGLTGELGKAVRGMSKSFVPTVTNTLKSFRRARLVKETPYYRSVPAKETSMKCSIHIGGVGEPLYNIFKQEIDDLNLILIQKGSGRQINLNKAELEELLQIPGEIDRVGNPDWGVDDVYGEIVDAHVNATFNIAFMLFKKLEEEQKKRERAKKKK